MQGDYSADQAAGAALWARADRVLPGGAIYLTRSADFAGRGILPGFIAKASGCRVKDVDGRSYIDLMGANGPNLLGYRHPEVETAARNQADKLVSASLFPAPLVDLIEHLVTRYDRMDWGMAAKTGSETLSFGVRIARHHTGRRNVIAFTSAYHGSDDEFALYASSETLAQSTTAVTRIPWNDAQKLEDIASEIGNQTAAILLNPLDQNPRQPAAFANTDFVAAIKGIQEKYGIVLILDDVRHGFRLHPDGSENLLGVDPDIICLGKALGNGYAISALLAKEGLRAAAQKQLITSTYHFEAPPMSAAIATLEIYDREKAFSKMVDAGERLKLGFEKAAQKNGHDISYSGPVTMPTFLFKNDPKHDKLKMFARKSSELGAIFHPFLNWNLSLAHGDADIDEAITIADEAMAFTAQRFG